VNETVYGHALPYPLDRGWGKAHPLVPPGPLGLGPHEDHRAALPFFAYKRLDDLEPFAHLLPPVGLVFDSPSLAACRGGDAQILPLGFGLDHFAPGDLVDPVSNLLADPGSVSDHGALGGYPQPHFAGFPDYEGARRDRFVPNALLAPKGRTEVVDP